MSDVKAPFGDCKKAVLHLAGAIQPFGALIGIDAQSHLIDVCSANAGEFLEQLPEVIVGQSAQQFFGDDWSRLSKTMTQLDHHQIDEWIAPSGKTMTLIAHRQGGRLLVEFEQRAAALPVWWDHAARIRFVETLSKVRSVEKCIALLVEQVALSTGYDRVMCYRFLPDWHGEVIHEVCRAGVDGYLGLRFPASDLPANVRQLYTLNWQRMIADVNGCDQLLCYSADNTTPLDMTYSMLRAVHPVHIQYLHNMGVEASFSLSLVVNGKLWGLVACHHFNTHALSAVERLSLVEIAKLISLHLQNLLSLVLQEKESQMREKMSRLHGALYAMSDNPKNGLAVNIDKLADMFQTDGAWLHFQGEDFIAGVVPDSKSREPLRDWMELQPRDVVKHYHHLPEMLRRYRALVRNASGILLIPLSTTDFLVLMRQEVVQVVHWAGQPASLDDNDTSVLTPRHSFSVWAQELRHSAEPWSDVEIACAEILRREFIDYITLANLEKIGLHDSLTGLANRLQFDRRLQQEVRKVFSQNTQIAVHMIDLDKFKPVNDSLGHAAGDELLRMVAQRLMSLVRAQDTIARLGGDEFALIQSGVADKTAASQMADRIVNEIAKPYDIFGHAVEIGASVGVALYPADTAVEHELLENADLALYEVKKSGRNAFSLYLPTMRDEADREVEANLILTALEKNQLRLHFQPIVDARNNDLRGLECFVRWQHPQKGLLPAIDFMPLIEKHHLASQLAEWVIEAVFIQHKQWRSMGLATVPMSINISASQFISHDWLALIQNLAVKYASGYEWLRLDIKEQAILGDVPLAIRKLSKLRDAGVAAHLDNFGSGFIPLGFMAQLPFVGIKFDASTLHHDEDLHMGIAVLNIVKGISQVLHAKLMVTRVESTAIATWLRDQGVDLLQGFAIAPPMDADAIEKWLEAMEKPNVQNP